MATQYNGFIIIPNKKPIEKNRKVSTEKTLHKKQALKKETLLQESLAHKKSETKKIYSSNYSKPSSIKGSGGKLADNIKNSPNILHTRSNSRTLEPHEIVFLKDPPATPTPCVSNNICESSDDIYQSDFESDFESCSESSSDSKTKTESSKNHSSLGSNSTTVLENKSSEIKRIKPLDTVTFDLFHLEASEYNLSDSLRHNVDTRNSCTQTIKECKSVDVQTKHIELRSVATSCTDNSYGKLYDSKLNTKKNLTTDFKVEKLHLFIKKAANMVMTVLLSDKKIRRSVRDGVISESIYQLTNTSITAPAKSLPSKISLIYSNPLILNIIITLHIENEEHLITQESLICLWNLFYPTEPIRIFSSWNNISCLCMHLKFPDIVIAGAHDGTVIVWDADEKVQWNRSCPLNFHSAPSAVVNSVDYKRILSICPCDKVKIKDLQSFKILTLNEDGQVVEWLVIVLASSNDESLIQTKTDNSSLWSKIRIIRLQTLSLFANVTKLDENISPLSMKKSLFEEKMIDFAATQIKYDATTEGVSKTTHMLADEETIIVLTNKNFLFISYQCEDLKFKKYSFSNDVFTYATACCRYFKNCIALNLSNGLLKICNFTSSSKLANSNNVKKVDDEEEIVLDSSYNICNNQMFTRTKSGQIFLASDAVLCIVHKKNIESLIFNKPIKSIQHLMTSNNDEQLVMLFSNGDMMVYDIN